MMEKIRRLGQQHHEFVTSLSKQSKLNTNELLGIIQAHGSLPKEDLDVQITALEQMVSGSEGNVLEEEVHDYSKSVNLNSYLIAVRGIRENRELARDIYELFK